MKSFFRNALYMGLFAVVSVLVMDLMLANILFTVFHGIFGDDWYLLPYALSVLVVLSAVMIAGWRIHAAHEEGEEKREYLKLIEGKEFDAAEVKKLRRGDTRHRTVLIAALVVSVIEGLFVTGVPFIGPFQFILFWIVENTVYMKNRRVWAADRLHK